MKTEERGYVLVLVLILMALGTLFVIPTLQLAYASLRAKQVNTSVFTEQYARDGAAEYAIWQLLYGEATDLLTEGNPEENYLVTLNGFAVDVVIKMRTTLGTTGVAGAEDNKIKTTETVECEITPGSPAFDDPCLPSVPTDPGLPNSAGMRARYTITLEQISPDLSVGVVAVYNELSNGFDIVSGSADSPDGSFPEIVSVTPTDILGGGDEIWKWCLSYNAASCPTSPVNPVYFTQGEKKKFRFIATINSSNGNYCNRSFVKYTAAPPPYEHSGPTAKIKVGTPTGQGCANGAIQVTKFVNTRVARPGLTTKFTYIINIENLSNNTLQVSRIKDVLPQGTSDGSVFKFCDPPPAVPPPPNPDLITCDAPKYKLADAPFNPPPPDGTGPAGGFEDPTWILAPNLGNPTLTYNPSPDYRWDLVWTGANPWRSIAQNGQVGDVLIIRFQAHVTPEASGSYYNEIFVDIDTGCSAPTVLRPGNEDVITNQEYCAAYSWPSGGTLVPAYDVRADAGTTTGQGNVAVGQSDASLDSWTVVNQ